jgi:hypothetical protein
MCEIIVDSTGKVHVRLFSIKNGKIDFARTAKKYGMIVGIIAGLCVPVKAYFDYQLKVLHKTLFKPRVQEFVESFVYTKEQTDSVVNTRICALIKPVCFVQDTILKYQRVQIEMDITNHGVDVYKKALEKVSLIEAGTR